MAYDFIDDQLTKKAKVYVGSSIHWEYLMFAPIVLLGTQMNWAIYCLLKKIQHWNILTWSAYHINWKISLQTIRCDGHEIFSNWCGFLFYIHADISWCIHRLKFLRLLTISNYLKVISSSFFVVLGVSIFKSLLLFIEFLNNH